MRLTQVGSSGVSCVPDSAYREWCVSRGNGCQLLTAVKWPFSLPRKSCHGVSRYKGGCSQLRWQGTSLLTNTVVFVLLAPACKWNMLSVQRAPNETPGTELSEVTSPGEPGQWIRGQSLRGTVFAWLCSSAAPSHWPWIPAALLLMCNVLGFVLVL